MTPIEKGSLLARFHNLKKHSHRSPIDINEVIDSQSQGIVPQPLQTVRRMIRSIITADLPESFKPEPKVDIGQRDNTSE